MQRDRYSSVRRDERGEYDHLGQRPGLLARERDYDMDRQTPFSTGLLGEGPIGMRGRNSGGILPEPSSLLGTGRMGIGANDSLTAGLQEQLMQHKRLEQQLNLRESQLALASNLLQQQNKMIGDIQGGAGLMGPAPQNIPSLLDAPLHHGTKRVNEGMRMDNKRSRFEDRDPVGMRRSNRRDISGDHGGRRRDDQYDPEHPTGDRGFSNHLSSRRHQEQIRGVSDVVKSNLARSDAQQHLRKIEGEEFCRICDETVKIPFFHHKKTTIHKKRQQQVNMGCGWCDVHNFTNFKDVLKHRETKKHIENEKKNKKKDSDRRDGRRPDRTKDDDVLIVGEKKPDKRPRHSNGTSHSKSKHSEKRRTEDKVKEEQIAFNVKDLEEAEKIEFDAERAIGQNLVIPATGFFCKLCHKFYVNEEAAKVAHCKTQAHFDKYKVAMIAKFKKKAEAEAKAKEEEAKTQAEEEEKEGTRDKEAGEEKETEIEDKTNSSKENVEEESEVMEDYSKVNLNDTIESQDGVVNEEDTFLDTSNQSQLEDNDEGDKQALMEDQDNDDPEETEEEETIPDKNTPEVEEFLNEIDESDSDKVDTTTKSPRSRTRGGKTRGGKARRGRKLV